MALSVIFAIDKLLFVFGRWQCKVMLTGGAGSGSTAGFVRWILLPVKGTGTWYEARNACAKAGGVIAPLGYSSYASKVNTFLGNIGTGGDWSRSTTYWGDEKSADQAMRWIGTSGQSVSKTERHKYFCMKSI